MYSKLIIILAVEYKCVFYNKVHKYHIFKNSFPRLFHMSHFYYFSFYTAFILWIFPEISWISPNNGGKIYKKSRRTVAHDLCV